MFHQFSNRLLGAPAGPSASYPVLVDHKDHDTLELIGKSSLIWVQRSQSLDEEDYALSPVLYGIYSVHIQMKFMVKMRFTVNMRAGQCKNLYMNRGKIIYVNISTFEPNTKKELYTAVTYIKK